MPHPSLRTHKVHTKQSADREKRRLVVQLIAPPQ